MRNSAFACPYLSIKDRANFPGNCAPANGILDLLIRDFHGSLHLSKVEDRQHSCNRLSDAALRSE